jgi:LPXTG-motif cell wall-anchored protein
MIFANALGAILPPGATTGPATEAKSGVGHFQTATKAPVAPANAPPVIPSVLPSTGTDISTAWVIGGILGLAALGFGVYKVTHKKP